MIINLNTGERLVGEEYCEDTSVYLEIERLEAVVFRSALLCRLSLPWTARKDRRELRAAQEELGELKDSLS